MCKLVNFYVTGTHCAVYMQINNVIQDQKSQRFINQIFGIDKSINKIHNTDLQEFRMKISHP